MSESANVNNGGPAFPESYGDIRNQCDSGGVSGGMTLRDYFAAHAPEPPHGWIGSEADDNKRISTMLSRPDNKIYAMVEWRWFYAAAMLAERRKVA